MANKNFVIRNQNADGTWDVLYPRTSAQQVVTTDEQQFISATKIAEFEAKASKDVATQTTDGLLSAADKVAIDGISTTVAESLAAAKTYTDEEIAKLVDSAPEAVNTLGELATALSEHEDAYDALLQVVGEKATKTELTEGLALKADQTALTEGLALKADQTALTEGLALKADQTALTEGLALKADASTVTQLSETVALKADKTYVDEQLALKANAQDVTDALALKADAQTVTDALALKADAQTVTEALALKADKETVTEDIATAIAEAGVTTVVVGTTEPQDAKPGDFWYEIVQ